jgi:two-component system, OmpR family, response regulator CpxR
MRSIALFPCSYTEGALIIGELSAALRMKVYTDAMLFEDISKHFGIPPKTLKRMIFGVCGARNDNTYEKEIFIDLARRTLALQKKRAFRKMFYGFHTLFLEPHIARVIKILVHDEERRRIKRAMHQDGFSRVAAREVVRQHDQKAAIISRFLFGKDPYDPSLYDVIIERQGKDALEVTKQLIQNFHDIENWFGHYQQAIPRSDNNVSSFEAIAADR